MRLLKRIVTVAAALWGSGCAALSGTGDALSTEQRLAMIPTAGLALERPVTIHWSREQIPFIEAETDNDAAKALGLVHAHLRLGQLEILRRISQGRIMEIAGPLGRVRDVEHALRIIDFGRTSQEVYARMPAEEKAFLDAFVAGLNHYQQNVATLPHEFGLLGLSRERWEPHEILTLGRLASVDVTWLVWMRLMNLRAREDWPALWARALEGGTASTPSFPTAENPALHDLAEILTGTARIGSNSFAVSGAKSRSGAAIIASDPHLGISLPNLWLLAGLKSPSYHMVGLMVPGLPFVAEGRNANIAWGGTNLRSAASDLIDVSGLPPDQITTREVETRVRFWGDRSMAIRETPYGPIISDANLLPKRDGEMFALKWIGHRPSDEVTAMLRMNRAHDWTEFRQGLEGFAISAQNFVYADTAGNIGQVTTTHLPRRSGVPPRDVIRPPSDAAAWDTILTSRDLPSSYNPPEGFVASANNKPAETPYPIGYFFSGDDRVLRLRELLSKTAGATPDDLRAAQSDTFMLSAAALRDAIVARARRHPALPAEAAAPLAALAAWDGRFDRNSRGAVAFQGTAAALIPLLVEETERAIIEAGGSEYSVYARLIAEAPQGRTDDLVATALAAASGTMAAYTTWGDMHRLTLEHNFRMVPVIGGRYRFGDFAWPGSTETLWRADHNLGAGPVDVGFGAQARHVSDMSDLDLNWFALLGGNDGWLHSENFLDQLDDFQDGLIQVPLRLETVRTRFPHKTLLRP
jgi:penicillin amidase